MEYSQPDRRHAPFRLLAPLLSVSLLVSACIILPIPTSEDKVLAGKPVSPGMLADLRPGITTKQAVVKQLGEPDAIWLDANVFCYNWTVRRGLLFFAVAPGDGMGVNELPKRYVLLMQFDNQDRLLRYEQLVRPKSIRYGEMLREWVSQPRGK
jgi:outer membrane protein assembly factor BamE (lipoprotein component of BamABCDE complex)